MALAEITFNFRQSRKSQRVNIMQIQFFDSYIHTI